MIISLVKITPYPKTRREILEILRSVECLTRTKTGCLGTSVYERTYEEEVILYLEQWQSREDFKHHVRSSQYDRILAAMDLAQEPPEISFFENDALPKGLAVIKAIRDEGIGTKGLSILSS